MATGPAESWNIIDGAPALTGKQDKGRSESPPTKQQVVVWDRKPQPQPFALTASGPCLPSSSFPEMGILQQGKDMKKRSEENHLSGNEA